MELDLDMYSPDASLLESTGLPTHLAIPSRGYAELEVYGGPNFQSFDYGFLMPFDHLGPPTNLRIAARPWGTFRSRSPSMAAGPR